MGLVPKDFLALPEFKEIDIYATVIPALEVGRDLYDFFPLDKDRICFVIGDVSDKGVSAALFMAMARTAFKISAIASPESIGLTMARVYQFLCESNPQQMFVTAFAGILDLRTGRVDYADAIEETLSRAGQIVSSERIINVPLDQTNVFVGEARESDDITMLVIRYLGRDELGTPPSSQPAT
jgi:phosphoserine phosphatase RsbU/P